jgi:uncharacterized repeat protein (TIGR03803 family)
MKYPMSLAPKHSCACTSRLLALAAIALSAMLLAQPAPAQIFTEVYSFPGGSSGYYPTQIAVNSAGTMYGTTQQGGSSANCGVVYQLSPQGVETVLYTFQESSSSDGCQPDGILLNPSNNILYGNTASGGSSICLDGCGTVFKVDREGQETILHTFTGSPDGQLPISSPIRDDQGNLYGVTYYGGSTYLESGAGTVYKITPSGQETVIYKFSAATGMDPYASPVIDSAGNLYGTTIYGGTGTCNNGFRGGCGVVFKLDPSGAYSVLHDFTGGKDGQYPTNLIIDKAGNLYGLSTYSGNGVIFEITTAGNFEILVQGPDLSTVNSLLLGQAGEGLIVTTYNSGSPTCTSNCGTVLQFIPTSSGSFNTVLLKTFEGSDGSAPTNLVEFNNLLYGTTFYGGADEDGTVFTLTP